MRSYNSTRVIITGAGSGIGLELSRLIYPETHHLLLVEIDPDRVQKLKKEFPEASILQIDLSQKEGNQTILDWIKDHWDSVEFCFANAGRAIYGSAENQAWESMEKLFQLNVYSPIDLGVELKKLFPNSGFRHIITCSAIGFWALPGYGIYGATKASILHWARSVWAEKNGNWLSLVFPISTNTDFFEAAGKSVPKSFPIQTPNKVANTIFRRALNGKRKIFPSFLFRAMLHLNSLVFFIRPLYQKMEFKKFKKWISKQS